MTCILFMIMQANEDQIRTDEHVSLDFEMFRQCYKPGLQSTYFSNKASFLKIKPVEPSHIVLQSHNNIFTL